MATFSAETTINGARIIDEHGRVVTSGISTWHHAEQVAALLNTGQRFPGRAVLLAPYNRAKRNDRQTRVKVVNGKTCNSPIHSDKPPVINSSRPRGY